MFTIKIFAILGLFYIIKGVFKIRSDWEDDIYERFWELPPPTDKEVIHLGIHCIIMEIILDIIINLIMGW